MRRYVWLLIGLVIIVVAVISYQAIPRWKDAEGGGLVLIGAVIVGVMAVASNIASIGKDLGLWKTEDDAEPAPGPTGGVHAGGDNRAEGGSVIAGTLQAENVGGIHHHHNAPEIKRIDDKPLELPPRAEHFTGREAEIEELVAKLKPGVVVTITGPGGMGKTALSGEALCQMTDNGTKNPEEFSDGVIFFSFYGKPNVNLAFEHIVREYGDELKPTPADAARRVLGRKRALLILDGAEEADNLHAVLGVRGGCGVLVTTRKGGVGQALKTLPEDEAMALLKAWGGDCMDDEEAARQICDLVGRLPLAVRLAGKYMAESQETASEFRDWLVETPLRALDHGERRQESVDVLLKKSLEQVSEKAGQALGVVGWLAMAPFTAEAVAMGLEMEERPTRTALGELVK